MSERSKKKLIYSLIIASVSLNLLLLVNVFALKVGSTKHYKQPSLAYIQQAISRHGEKTTPPPKPLLSDSEKNLLQTTYELARGYEKKAQRTVNLQEKADLYSLALLEYSKLPLDEPRYARLVREARERIQPQMLEISTPLVAPGDSRQQVRQIYGEPDRRIIDEKYMPSGTVTYEHYLSQGLVIGLSLDKVFSVKLCSQSPGIWHGVRIGDSFAKIRTLYKGEKIELPGGNFAYRVKDLNTTFVFVDADEKLDGIKISNRKYYGNWKLALK